MVFACVTFLSPAKSEDRKGGEGKTDANLTNFLSTDAAPPPRPGEAPHPAPSARKSATQTAQKTALCAPASTTCKPHSSRERGRPELGPSRLRDHRLG